MESGGGIITSVTNVHGDNVSRLIGVCMEYDHIILSRSSIPPYILRWADVGDSGSHQRIIRGSRHLKWQ
jgi:hypothetical protein